MREDFAVPEKVVISYPILEVASVPQRFLLRRHNKLNIEDHKVD